MLFFGENNCILYGLTYHNKLHRKIYDLLVRETSHGVNYKPNCFTIVLHILVKLALPYQLKNNEINAGYFSIKHRNKKRHTSQHIIILSKQTKGIQVNRFELPIIAL